MLTVHGEEVRVVERLEEYSQEKEEIHWKLPTGSEGLYPILADRRIDKGVKKVVFESTLTSIL